MTLTFGVEIGERRLAGNHLGLADRGGAVENLPLQIGEIDRIAVSQHQRTDAGGSQIQRGRRTQAAGTEYQHARGTQLFLPFDADLRQQDVAAVAQQFLIVHAEITVSASYLTSRSSGGVSS